MDQATIERLKAAVKALKGSYAANKKEVEEAVSVWRWATGRYFGLVPFQQERFQTARGKLLGSEPKSTRNAVAFGFDERDRLMLVRAFGPDGKPSVEEFITRSDDTTTARVYLQGGKMPGKVVEIAAPGGRPREMYEYGTGGDHLHDTYHYEGDTLNAIDVEQFHALMKKTFEHRLVLKYDGSGGGEAVRVDADGKETPAFSFSAPDHG